ncbi:MAG: hypothetical protein HYZ34_00590 [Ignavibacteriae bacterium]|nr:hypothetical protein [Ignavibacteriota bacterium]
MQAIKGIFNGKTIIALEKFPSKKKHKVLITFLEEVSEEEDLRSFVSTSNAFSFWEDGREDLYQDHLKKVKA